VTPPRPIHVAWLLTFALFVGLLASAFYLFPDWRRPPGLRLAPPPQVAWLCAPEEGSDENDFQSELNAIWSPALIALPPAVLQPDSLQALAPTLKPPLDVADGRVLFLTLAAPGEGMRESRLSFIPPLSLGNGDAGRDPTRSVRPPVFPHAQHNVPGPITVWATPPLTFARGAAEDFVQSLDAGSSTAWSLVLHIATDENGHVRQALVESSTAPAPLTANILRRLRRQRWFSAGSPTESRLTLQISGGTSPGQP